MNVSLLLSNTSLCCFYCCCSVTRYTTIATSTSDAACCRMTLDASYRCSAAVMWRSRDWDRRVGVCSSLRTAGWFEVQGVGPHRPRCRNCYQTPRRLARQQRWTTESSLLQCFQWPVLLSGFIAMRPPADFQFPTLSERDGSASLGTWHVRTLNRITIGSLGRRSDRPVIGGDLVDALVPAGWGRLILMYSQSTPGSSQPGERPVTARSSVVSSTRQHSIMQHATKEEEEEEGCIA